MAQTIDMQLMRYINLFEKVCHVSTTNCFVYNNIIFFAVPRRFISKAVGDNGKNMKKIGETFRKRIKVIEMIEDIKDLDRFVGSIVEPVKFTKLEVRDNIVILTAGMQSKAALIGRNRVREQELEDTLKKFFGVEKLKII
jgi:NusA-like KH domain protein